MSAMRIALDNGGIINIQEKLQTDFLLYVRKDGQLAGFFRHGEKISRQNTTGERLRNKVSDEFVSWVHKYNEGRSNVNGYVKPENTLPLEMYDCAKLFGYQGPNEFIKYWNFLKHILVNDGIVGIELEDFPDDIRFITLATVRLVEEVFDNKDTHIQENFMHHLRQLLVAIGGDMRGVSFTKASKKEFILRKIREQLEKNPQGMQNEELIVRTILDLTRSVSAK